METRLVTSSQFGSPLHSPSSPIRQDFTYCEHFGFAQPSFSVTTDPEFFYCNAAIEKILNALAREIVEKGGFVVVTGEPGTGKTTLLRRLIADSADEVDCVFIGVTARLSFFELLREILQQAGMSATSTDRESLLEQFDGYLGQRRAKDRGLALILDDAQEIRDEVLRNILLLCSSGGREMSIVLAGQPGLQGRLAQFITLKERMTLTKRLAPLRKHDIAPYIASRLRQGGYRREELFEQQAIDRIFDTSGGIPKLIDSLCDRALAAYRACEYKVTAKMIDQASHELRSDGRLPSASQRMPAETVQLRNERAFLAPTVEIEERVANLKLQKQDEKEIKSRSPTNMWTHLGQRGHPFFHIDRQNLSMGVLIILAVTAWSFIIVYQPRGAPAGSNAKQYEKISAQQAAPTHLPAETKRVENKAAAKARSQPAPTSVPSLARVEPSTKQDNLADAEKPIQNPGVGEGENPASEESYRVTGASFVRKEPTAYANIIETLQPGVRIAILDRSGEYYHVRSLGAHTVSGFVHRQDAFFERIQ